MVEISSSRGTTGLIKFISFNRPSSHIVVNSHQLKGVAIVAGRKPNAREAKACPRCGAMFSSRWARQVTCSRPCARQYDAQRFGPNNWKGGVNKAGGYLKELRKGHPYADRGGYVMQHRLVMEQVLGRTLDPKERVHHKNGVRDDNRPENLELWTVNHKDPAGVRAIDHARHAISKLSDADRARLTRELQAGNPTHGGNTMPPR